MNAVERAVVLARAEYLDQDEFPLIPRRTGSEGELPFEGTASEELPLDKVEKGTILRTLERTNGNKSEAARRLGITRRTLHKKLKLYGVMT